MGGFTELVNANEAIALDAVNALFSVAGVLTALRVAFYGLERVKDLIRGEEPAGGYVDLDYSSDPAFEADPHAGGYFESDGAGNWREFDGNGVEVARGVNDVDADDSTLGLSPDEYMARVSGDTGYFAGPDDGAVSDTAWDRPGADAASVRRAAYPDMISAEELDRRRATEKVDPNEMPF